MDLNSEDVLAELGPEPILLVIGARRVDLSTDSGIALPVATDYFIVEP